MRRWWSWTVLMCLVLVPGRSLAAEPEEEQKDVIHIVVRCADPRKEDVVQKWIDDHVDDAYTLSHLGGPAAFCSEDTSVYMMKQLKTIADFHPDNVVEVILISHIDCKAVGRSDTFTVPEEEWGKHKDLHRKAVDKILSAASKRIQTRSLVFYAGQLKNIDLQTTVTTNQE